MKGPTSPARENISPLREQCKSPVRELPHSPVREDQSPVKVTSKTGKKRQGESQKKRQMTHGHDSEFQRESQSVQSLNFDKVQKIDNQCEMRLPPSTPFHEKMTDIICSNFAFCFSNLSNHFKV